MSLQGKIVIVTGAARGLGAATVRQYAKLGARVVLADIRTELQQTIVSELKADGVDACSYNVDVSSDAQVLEFAESVLRNVGVPYIVHNNAAAIISGSILDIPLADIQTQLEINVLGYLRITRAFLPKMMERKSGQIVITSSPNGQAPPPMVAANLTAYCMCKAADVSLAQALTVSLQGKGIDVSLLFPPLVNTEGGHNVKGCAPEEFHKGLAQMMDSVGAKPEDAAEELVRGVMDRRYFVSAQPNYKGALKGWVESEQDPSRDWLNPG